MYMIVPRTSKLIVTKTWIYTKAHHILSMVSHMDCVPCRSLSAKEPLSFLPKSHPFFFHNPNGLWLCARHIYLNIGIIYTESESGTHTIFAKQYQYICMIILGILPVSIRTIAKQYQNIYDNCGNSYMKNQSETGIWKAVPIYKTVPIYIYTYQNWVHLHKESERNSFFQKMWVYQCPCFQYVYANHIWEQLYEASKWNWNGMENSTNIYIYISILCTSTQRVIQYLYVNHIWEHFSWWVLQHRTRLARLVWGRSRIHQASCIQIDLYADHIWEHGSQYLRESMRCRENVGLSVSVLSMFVC